MTRVTTACVGYDVRPPNDPFYGVARLFDGGLDAQGQPFVEGGIRYTRWSHAGCGERSEVQLRFDAPVVVGEVRFIGCPVVTHSKADIHREVQSVEVIATQRAAGGRSTTRFARELHEIQGAWSRTATTVQWPSNYVLVLDPPLTGVEELVITFECDSMEELEVLGPAPVGADLTPVNPRIGPLTDEQLRAVALGAVGQFRYDLHQAGLPLPTTDMPVEPQGDGTRRVVVRLQLPGRAKSVLRLAFTVADSGEILETRVLAD